MAVEEKTLETKAEVLTEDLFKSPQEMKELIDEATEIVREQEMAYLRTRFLYDRVLTTYKARIEAVVDEASRENAGLRKQMGALNNECSQARERYENSCLLLRRLRFENGDNAARLTPCAEVKAQKSLEYDPNLALEYLVRHGLTQFISIDVARFEKAAPHLFLGFVKEVSRPKLYIAQDMAKALKYDTSELEAQAQALIEFADKAGDDIPLGEILDNSSESLDQNQAVR
jgi:hypothetical protein